jgi:hypothetical protein
MAQGAATIAAATSTGDLMPMHLAHGFRAWAASRARDAQLAAIEWDRYEALVQQLGGRLVYADWFKAGKAEAALYFDSPDRAAQLAAEAIDFADRVDGIFASGIAHRVAGLALAAQDPTRASAIDGHMAQSLELLNRGEANLEAARTHFAWARTLEARGETEAADRHFMASEALAAD